jgi:hypothetical protein
MYKRIKQPLYSSCGEAPMFKDKSEHEGGKVVRLTPQEIFLVL